MTKVLITGASGFTGKVLTNRLCREPDLNVLPLTRSQLDLSNSSAVRNVLAEIQPNWIFHLAGKLKGSPSELFQANTQNTIHLLEAAPAGARILLIGSAAEYGYGTDSAGPIPETFSCRPTGAYGISKYAMTLAGLDFAKTGKVQVNIARTFNLIGPGIPATLLLGALIERVRRAVAQNESTIKVGEVSAERDFIDVRDAAEAYLAIMRSIANAEIFNVCTGQPTRVKDLVEAALKISPKQIQYEVDPSIAAAGAKSVIGDPSKLRALGFTPKISIDESLAAACVQQ